MAWAIHCNYSECDTWTQEDSPEDWITVYRWGQVYHACSWDHLMQWAASFGVDRIDV